MVGWYVQETQVGGRPAAVDILTGAYLVISELDVADPNQITAAEIEALTNAHHSCASPVVPLRLYRFNMINRSGELTEEGETALAHLTFERSGITAFANIASRA